MMRSPASDRSRPGYRGRLFRYDRLIAWNVVRATFAGLQDRAIAVTVLLAALGMVRAWFDGQPPTIAIGAAAIGGFVVGIGAGRMVAARIGFHAFDGLLASDALQAPVRWYYRGAWFGVGLLVLGAITLVVRPSLSVASLPAYLIGTSIATLTAGMRLPGGVGRAMRPGRYFRAWTHRPVAGLCAAFALILCLLPARMLGVSAQLAYVGIGASLLTVLLTPVDDAVVRFMDVAGHGSRRIVGRHARGAATFLVAAVPGCWLMLGPMAAGIVVAAGIAMLVLLTLRILAYRLHDRRFADFLVSILTGLLMLVAYSMPIALPVIALVLLWQLQRRARTKSWLLP